LDFTREGEAARPIVGRRPARAAFPMIGHYRRGLAVIGFEEIHSALYVLDPLQVKPENI
jgi:hypothetical protein